MPFPTTLTAGMLTKLRSSRYAGKLRVFIWEPETIFAARVNGAVNTAGYGFINYDTVTTGSFGDIEIGQTIYISATNDIKAAYFVGRIRLAAAAQSIYINESSVVIGDNDYIFVTDDHRLWPKLPYLSFGVQYKDFSIAFRQIPPFFTALKSAYAAEVSSGSASFSFDGSAQAATSGATISSRLWDIADGTFTVGNSASTSPTVSFPQGARWVSCLLTDSGGRTTTIRVFVVVNGPDFPATHTIDGINIQTSASGWANQLAAFDGIEDVLNGALVVIYDASELYGTDSGSLIDNIKFVGRLRFEITDTAGDPVYALTSETKFTLDDLRAQLARIHGASIAVRNIASPNEWDEINDLTYQRAIIHFLREHTTALELAGLQFDETFDSTYETGDFPIQGQDALSCVNSIAKSRLDAQLEFTAAGEMRITRDALLMTTADKNAMTTVAGFTDGSSGSTSDYLKYSISMDQEKPVGKMTVNGGSYNTTSGTYVTRTAVSPGTAQDTGAGRDQLDGQVYAANLTLAQVITEAKRLSGAALDRANASTRLTIDFPDGYHFLVPSRGYWYTHVIAASENTRGRAFTTSHRWLLESISMQHDNETGARVVRAVFLLEETRNYTSVIYDPQGESAIDTPAVPYIPVEDVYPGIIPEPPYDIDIPVEDMLPVTKDDPLPRDGNVIVFATDDQVWNSAGFLRSNNPDCNEITPDGIGTIRAVLVDQFAGSNRVWILDNPSVDTSSLYTAENGLVVSPDWDQAAAVDRIYTVLRKTPEADGVAIYSPEGDSAGIPATIAFECTAWCSINTETDGNQTMVWEFPGGASYTFGDNNVVVTLDVTYDYRDGDDSDGCLYDGGFQVYADFGSGYAWVGATNTPTLFIGIVCNDYIGGNSGPMTKTMTITRDLGTYPTVSIQKARWTSANPGGDPMTIVGVSCEAEGYLDTTDKSVVAYYANYGADIDGLAIVGDEPGAMGGFDFVRSGDESLAAANAQAMIATSILGSYSNATQGGTTATDPILLIIPWYRRTSTSVKNFDQGSITEYIMGSAAAVSGASLWWINSAGTKTDISPTISATLGLPVGPNCLTVWKGTYLAGIFNFGGTRKLVTSPNGGATWTDRGAVNAASDYIILRRSQSAPKQFYFNSGATIGYTNDWGVTIVYKTLPTSDTIKYLDVLG